MNPNINPKYRCPFCSHIVDMIRLPADDEHAFIYGTYQCPDCLSISDDYMLTNPEIGTTGNEDSA